MFAHILLIQVLVISLSQAADFLNIGIQNHSGLYYQRSGHVRFTTAEWRLATYVDFKEFITQRPLITFHDIENTNETCQLYQKDEHRCGKILQTENLVEKNKTLEKYLQEFLQFVAEYEEDQSVKEIFLEGFESTLNGTELHHDRVQKKSSTHIVQAGLYYLHDEIIRLKNISIASLKDVEKAHLVIEESIEDNGTFIMYDYEHLIQSIEGWVEGVNMELDNYIYTLQTLIDVIHSTKSGIVHDKLFTYEGLENSVNNFIRANKDESLIFPLAIDELHSDKLPKIAKTSIGFYDGKLVAIISIPLLNPTVYDLHRMYPYPALQVFGHEQGSAYIRPRADFLLLNHRHYTLAQTADISLCRATDDRQFICEPKYPLYDTTLQPICEAAIIMKNGQLEPFEDCDIKLKSTFTPYWRRTEDGWLYSVPNEREVNIICDGEWNDVVNITGAGILQMRMGCEAFTLEATMTGYQRDVNMSLEPTRTRMLNVTTLVPNPDCFQSLPKYYIRFHEFLNHHQISRGSMFPTIISFTAWMSALFALLLHLPRVRQSSNIDIIEFRDTAV